MFFRDRAQAWRCSRAGNQSNEIQDIGGREHQHTPAFSFLACTDTHRGMYDTRVGEMSMCLHPIIVLRKRLDVSELRKICRWGAPNYPRVEHANDECSLFNLLCSRSSSTCAQRQNGRGRVVTRTFQIGIESGPVHWAVCELAHETSKVRRSALNDCTTLQ